VLELGLLSWTMDCFCIAFLTLFTPLDFVGAGKKVLNELFVPLGVRVGVQSVVIHSLVFWLSVTDCVIYRF